MFKFIIFKLFLLIGLSSILYAASCTQYSFNKAARLRSEVIKEYNAYVHKSNEIEEKYKNIKWLEYDDVLNLTRLAMKDINKVINNAKDLKANLQDLKNKYTRAKKYSYSVHESCTDINDHTNAETAYKNYSHFYDTFNDDRLYGKNNFFIKIDKFIEHAEKDRQSIESALK